VSRAQPDDGTIIDANKERFHVRTQNFSLGGGGTDPEAIYNLRLVLNIML
jgi:hypothetical protein